MKQTDHIKRFLAAFVLLLFSFCITPKRILHDWLANHRDAQTYPHIPFEQVASSGFHCHLDDLVVVSPFLPGIQNNIPVTFPFSVVPFSEPLSAFYIGYQSSENERGPPASCYS